MRATDRVRTPRFRSAGQVSRRRIPSGALCGTGRRAVSPRRSRPGGRLCSTCFASDGERVDVAAARGSGEVLRRWLDARTLGTKSLPPMSSRRSSNSPSRHVAGSGAVRESEKREILLSGAKSAVSDFVSGRWWQFCQMRVECACGTATADLPVTGTPPARAGRGPRPELHPQPTIHAKQRVTVTLHIDAMASRTSRRLGPTPTMRASFVLACRRGEHASVQARWSQPRCARGLPRRASPLTNDVSLPLSVRAERPRPTCSTSTRSWRVDSAVVRRTATEP